MHLFLRTSSFKIMLSIIFPIAIFTTLLSERIVLFVYGIGYTASVVGLQIVFSRSFALT
jgi:O-antigen/teichoic acid export membrane protein